MHKVEAEELRRGMEGQMAKTVAEVISARFRERAVFLSMAGVFALMAIWLLPPKNLGPIVAVSVLAAVFVALAFAPSSRQ